MSTALMEIGPSFRRNTRLTILVTWFGKYPCPYDALLAVTSIIRSCAQMQEKRHSSQSTYLVCKERCKRSVLCCTHYHTSAVFLARSP